MLENAFNPFITQAFKNQLNRGRNLLPNEAEIYFHQDEAPSAW